MVLSVVRPIVVHTSAKFGAPSSKTLGGVGFRVPIFWSKMAKSELAPPHILSGSGPIKNIYIDRFICIQISENFCFDIISLKRFLAKLQKTREKRVFR